MLKDLKSLNIPLGLPRWLSANNQLAIAEDMGSIPDVERSLGEGNGDLLQYSCLEIFLTCSTQESFSLFSGKLEFIFIASFHMCCTLKIRLKANYKWVLFFFFFFFNSLGNYFKPFSLQVACSYPFQITLGGLFFTLFSFSTS